MPFEQSAVTCPRCQHQFPLPEALTRELVAPLLPGLRQEVAKEVRAGFDDDLEIMRRQNKEQAELLNEQAEQLGQLREGEAQLRRERRELKEQKDDLERKTEQLRDEITNQEQEKADQRARDRLEVELRRREEEYREQDRAKDDRHRDEVRELQQKLERTNRDLTDLQRNTRTGSDTEQGYARQDVFVHDLEERFRQDGVTPLKRGQGGADVEQLVRLGASGCGTILWEVKRAKTWQPGWIDKLIGDRDKASATIGVIVTEALPPGMDGFGERDGVWITGFGDALNLAGVLREMIITAWKRDVAAAMRDENAGKVYDYVMNGPFARHLGTLGRVAERMLDEVRLDRNALEQRWKRTEKNIREILAVREAIPLDLLERLDGGTELPPGLTAELPTVDIPLALPGSSS